jgi:hypothetical protein
MELLALSPASTSGTLSPLASHRVSSPGGPQALSPLGSVRDLDQLSPTGAVGDLEELSSFGSSGRSPLGSAGLASPVVALPADGDLLALSPGCPTPLGSLGTFSDCVQGRPSALSEC